MQAGRAEGRASRAGPARARVHVEDHPLDYATRGRDPKGEYGAGQVEIWDNGTYELLEEKKDGGLTVRLRGERLDGVWTLVPAKLDGDPKNWLILRKREEGAAAPRERWKYKPMLATLTDDVPKGDAWLHEVKWDGYRAIADVRGAETTLTSRNDNDLTVRFESVAKEITKAVTTPDCVLDGECARSTRTPRHVLRYAAGKQGTAVRLVVFDHCSRLMAHPSSTCRSPSAASACRSSSTDGTSPSSSPIRSTTAMRCTTPR